MSCPFLIFLVVLLSSGLVAVVQAGEWEAPAWADTLSNPFQGDSALAAQAPVLYQKNCSACHGLSGKGDGTMAHGMQPPPADFTDAEMMSDESDGDLFWKISNGKKPMPEWKKKLDSQQIWGLVEYVRKFSQPITPADSLKTVQPDSL